MALYATLYNLHYKYTQDNSWYISELCKINTNECEKCSEKCCEKSSNNQIYIHKSVVKLNVKHQILKCSKFLIINCLKQIK